MRVYAFESFDLVDLSTRVNEALDIAKSSQLEVVSVTFTQTIGTMNPDVPDELRPLTACFIVVK
jgi:hypothetical protein